MSEVQLAVVQCEQTDYARHGDAAREGAHREGGENGNVLAMRPSMDPYWSCGDSVSEVQVKRVSDQANQSAGNQTGGGIMTKQKAKKKHRRARGSGSVSELRVERFQSKRKNRQEGRS
jgi:hypothetical protein